MRLLVWTVLFALACGGSTSQAPGSTDGTAAEECDYEPGDPCITEDNLAECRARAEECPGDVQVLESCPLQFACP